MYDNTNSTTLYNPFGGSVNVSFGGKNYYGDDKAFIIRLTGIPQEACIELLTQDWGSSTSGLIALGYGGEIYSATIGCRDGTFMVCANSGVMSVDKAISVCTYSEVLLKFY